MLMYILQRNHYIATAFFFQNTFFFSIEQYFTLYLLLHHGNAILVFIKYSSVDSDVF